MADVHYTYDAAGNILKAADTPTSGTAETQCYAYDGLQRLTTAWTPVSGDCAPAASTAGLGGAAAYWKSWTFNGTGVAGSTDNRLTETTHAAAGDTTVTSKYTQAGHPHGVSATTTTVGGTQTATASYTYDADGNMTSRPGVNGQQTLTWDAENHLSTLVDGSSTYTYVYDADGNRLLTRDATGATLTIGNVELRLTTATGARTAERYFTFNGQTVAQRTAAGLEFLACDPNGTSTIAIDDTTAQNTTKRYQDPYGNPIGPSVTWVGTKTFVGGDQDPTGLVHEGAREYDPKLGTFISRDPVMEPDNPPQLNGYTYGWDNPVVHPDPTGLRPYYDEDMRANTPPKSSIKTVYTDDRHASLVRHHAPHARIATSGHTYTPHRGRQNGGCYYHTGGGPTCFSQPPRTKCDIRNCPRNHSSDIFQVSSQRCGKFVIEGVCPAGTTVIQGAKPKHEIDIETIGLCVSLSAGAFAYYSISACSLIDSKGSGLSLTGGYQQGPAAPFGSASASLLLSNGSVIDQRGGFDTKTIGGGVGATFASTYSTGTSPDGRPITTVEFGGGPGDGVQFGTGTSNTALTYHRY